NWIGSVAHNEKKCRHKEESHNHGVEHADDDAPLAHGTRPFLTTHPSYARRTRRTLILSPCPLLFLRHLQKLLRLDRARREPCLEHCAFKVITLVNARSDGRVSRSLWRDMQL